MYLFEIKEFAHRGEGVPLHGRISNAKRPQTKACGRRKSIEGSYATCFLGVPLIAKNTMYR